MMYVEEMTIICMKNGETADWFDYSGTCHGLLMVKFACGGCLDCCCCCSCLFCQG